MRLDVKRNAILGTFWGVISRSVGLLFPFIIRTVIIRLLGSEYEGLGGLFTSILQVLSLAELGFGNAMVFAMYRPIADNDLPQIRSILCFYKRVYLIIGTVVLCLGISVLPFLDVLVKDTPPADINIYFLFSIYLANTVLSYFFFGYRNSVLVAYQRQDIISKLSLLINVGMYILQIVLLVTFKNYYYYVLCIPIGTICTNYVIYSYSKKAYPDIYPDGVLSKEQKSNIYEKISALMLHKIGGIVLNSADTIVISSFLGLVVVSNYNNYYYLINAISGIIMVLFTSLTAGIGNSLIIDDIEEKKKKFYSILFVNAAVVTVCTCCFFSLFQDFITVWVGKEKLFENGIMVLFCLYFYIHMIRRTILMYRDAAGLWKENRWQPIVSASFNLIVNIFLVQKIGVYGILISSILAQVFIDIPWESGITTKKILNEPPHKYFGVIYSFAFVTLLSMLVIKVIIGAVNVNPILKLVVELCTAIIISVSSVFVFSMLIPVYRKLIFSRIKRYAAKHN